MMLLFFILVLSGLTLTTHLFAGPVLQRLLSLALTVLKHASAEGKGQQLQATHDCFVKNVLVVPGAVDQLPSSIKVQ